MHHRVAPIAAGLSMLGLLALLLHQAPGRPRPPASPRAGAESGSPGRDAACAVPLHWRIARVDPRFDLDAARARAAVEDAAALWESAAGRRLFAHDSAGGFPIRFVYDERQARTRERLRLEAEFDAETERLEAWRADLDRWIEEHARASERHTDDARGLESRVARHNAAVRRWNEAGGSNAGTATELEQAAAALRADRRALEQRAREIEAESRRLEAERRRFGNAVSRHDRRAERLRQEFPATPIESGVYRDRVSRVAGRTVAVEREIVIFRFDDRADLVRVLAHELGHALGLGHNAVPGSIMSEQVGRADPAVAPAVHPSDVALLRSRCPDP